MAAGQSSGQSNVAAVLSVAVGFTGTVGGSSAEIGSLFPVAGATSAASQINAVLTDTVSLVGLVAAAGAHRGAPAAALALSGRVAGVSS